MTDAYRRAGVDIEAAAKAVTLIGDLASRTRRPEVADEVGGFAGLFRIGDGKLLAAATDGVGTKLEIARATGRLDTVGVDLVAMCADDVVCTGAEPLFFLDYLAVGAVVPERVAAIVEGVAEGCRQAGCALLGGETAEHPGTMSDDRFDLAGFCVGAVDEASLLGPSRVREGDVLVGLASSGLHANGYSLVRHALLARHGLDDTPPELRGRTVADELLEPCAIYVNRVLSLARDDLVHAAAHITGGGFQENVPRAMPEGLGAEIQRGTWPEQPVFSLVRAAAGAGDDEMFATFNMGLGMVLVVDADDAEQVLDRAGETAFRIGRVARGAGVRIT
ncbi:MAG TPA: phosphoribosylformylglycinamidine cyclo-ligase [Actinomycetota bacterium]|nr:phosphoribosylformylglycinamidine cyclo-ligase [Actinomycetota bacterium]